MTISAIIPTCNRYKSLMRTLTSLSKQQALPNEVIIIDASTISADEYEFKTKFPTLHITYLHTNPSVCAQRNIGIQKAKGSHIFLCDDDLEFPDEYILKIKNFILKVQNAHVVSGLILEKNEKNEWSYMYPVKSIAQLCWRFIFQQSIWYTLKDMHTNYFNKYIHQFISDFYSKRKNTYTLAGWPLVTDFNPPVFKTAFYGLGASIIDKEWLVISPFDETLDKNGMGDNYGIALHFPNFPAIHVLTDTHVYHHKINTNRLSASEAYYKRVLALNYFITNAKRFNFVNKAFLIWSLFGNMLVHANKRNKKFLKVSVKLIYIILTSMPRAKR